MLLMYKRLKINSGANQGKLELTFLSFQDVEGAARQLLNNKLYIVDFEVPIVLWYWVFPFFSFWTWTKCKLWDQCCSSRINFNVCVFCIFALIVANKHQHGLNVVIRSSHMYHSRNNPGRKRWESFSIDVELNCESIWTANRTESIILAITLEKQDEIHLRLVSN